MLPIGRSVVVPRLVAGQYAFVADHAVLVYIASLVNPDSGLDEIEDPLIEAIESAGVGELDGIDIGPDGVVLYMYGPDADALWDVVRSVLPLAAIGAGSYAIKRYGEPGSEEVRIPLV